MRLGHTKVAAASEAKPKNPGKRVVCATGGWKVDGAAPQNRCCR